MKSFVTSDRLSAILDKMSSLRIAVLGDLMLDTYITGSATRLSQEAPVPVLHVRKREKRLGGAANVMRNLKAIAPDCTVYAFGVIGNDEAGKELKELLSSDGIDVSKIVVDPTRRTTEKQRVIAGSQQLVRMDFEDTFPIRSETSEKIAVSLTELMREHKLDAVIFEDYAKGMLEKELLSRLTKEAVKNNIYTSLDPHPGHPLEVKDLSLMTPNRAEAFGLAGMYCHEPAVNVEDDADLKKVAGVLFDKWSPRSLLITLGHQGMALFNRETPDVMFAIPTIAREVFDVSGAGDTVISVYTLCMASGADGREAAEISNHAAGIVVGKAGTAVTSREELEASFKD